MRRWKFFTLYTQVFYDDIESMNNENEKNLQVSSI